MSRNIHNHRSLPTNVTKRKSIPIMTDSTQATNQRKVKQQPPLLSSKVIAKVIAMQDPQNTTVRQRKGQNMQNAQQQTAARSHYKDIMQAETTLT